MKDRLVAIKKAGIRCQSERDAQFPFKLSNFLDRTEALFVISQLMSNGQVMIFEDAKKKAFLQEAQIMKDFRGPNRIWTPNGGSKVLQWSSFPKGQKFNRYII